MQLKRTLIVTMLCCLLLLGFSKIYAGPVQNLPSHDQGINRVDTREQCYRCGGTGWVTCPACNGTGKTVEGGICLRCGGVGRVLCDICRGKGYIER
jgi:DnaJ-class molecular chaperone